jgi:hypothetical protein
MMQLEIKLSFLEKLRIVFDFQVSGFRKKYKSQGLNINTAFVLVPPPL